MLKLENVTKVFLRNTPDEVTALSDIDLSVEEGDFVTIIGSNGAGKSTLLQVITGFVTVDEGTIEVMERDVTRTPPHQRAKYIGRIAQDPGASVCGVMTIEENLAMADLRGRRRGLRVAVTSKNRPHFRDALCNLGLGLEGRLSARVATLSGGQRQALALLMATLAKPKLLLLDEHIASLDPKTAEQVMQLTNDLVTKYQLTTLMVTHNMSEAIRWGERLIMMHEGKIILDISGEEKQNLKVSDLTAKFQEASHEEFAVDRMLLSV
jgi:putative ABC transport system ATP-binding protein